MSTASNVYLAVDLGASSGRVVAGHFDGGKIRLEEVHRFTNGGVRANDRLHWDVLGQWQHILDGLRAAGDRFGDAIVSVGVDTWGVDFGLLGRGDQLLGNPFHYRDEATNGALERAFQVVPREEIFAESGLQFMSFNTLYQLIALREANSPLLEMAESFLMIPDLFHWLLTGRVANEYTNATTTQFYNPQQRDWSRTLLERFDLPTDLFGEVLEPGAKLGLLRDSVREATGLGDVGVVLPGTHDTASAVMAVPAAGAFGSTPDWCYISSGTWSLMGAETPAPVISEACRELNFTNEGGVGGSIRLLKNIAGLWLVQECRRCWELEGRSFDWSQLVGMAADSAPLVSLLDPDHPSLVAPKSMPEAMGEFCRATSQPTPDSEGAVIRTALESLALRYRMVLDWTEQLAGAQLDTIHIVGGGSQNELLCQMAADACNRRVLAGPVEATAIGNLMVQALANGDVGSIQEAREVIRNSFDVQEYSPQGHEPWNEAYGRFQKLLA